MTINETVEHALAEPGEPDLIVVNIGNPREVRPQSRIDAAERGLDRHLQRGGALLGVHVSATSMTTMTGWSGMLGGHWVRGRTMHPAQDLATIIVRTGAHPIVHGLDDFTVFDERYSYIHTNPDITVLCEHSTDGRMHPIVWARESGPARPRPRHAVLRQCRSCGSATSHGGMALAIGVVQLLESLGVA